MKVAMEGAGFVDVKKFKPLIRPRVEDLKDAGRFAFVGDAGWFVWGIGCYLHKVVGVGG